MSRKPPGELSSNGGQRRAEGRGPSRLILASMVCASSGLGLLVGAGIGVATLNVITVENHAALLLAATSLLGGCLGSLAGIVLAVAFLRPPEGGQRLRVWGVFAGALLGLAASAVLVYIGTASRAGPLVASLAVLGPGIGAVVADRALRG